MVRYVKKHVDGAVVTTLFQFKEPVSPHVAVRGAAFTVNISLNRAVYVR